MTIQTPPTAPVWVITWHYRDNSAFGVVAVRSNKDDAEKLCAFLQEHSGSRQFQMHPVEGTKV